VFRRNRREDAGQSRRGSPAEPDQQDLDELDELDDDELDDDELDDDELDDDELDDELDEPAEDEDAPAPSRRSEARDTDLGDPATWTRLRDSGRARRGGTQESGPWDATAGYPDGDRMDFGSLLVPMREGFDIQVNLDEEAGIWIAVVYGDSALQLQAFAAPKTSGLWNDVRQEIAAEVAKAGGQSEAAQGPFGDELIARLAPPGQPPQLLRFMGADGPRWFLRGLLTGPAAQDADVARPFEEVFADVVVVRGDHAEPPRKALDIELPEEARQAIEQQMETEGDGMPNPFERGPEITEIR
jgi:hypothetical protein